MKRLHRGIFPYHMDTVALCNPITEEPLYERIYNLASKICEEPQEDQIEFLLRYKKYVDDPKIYSMAGAKEIIQMNNILEYINTHKEVEGCIVETGVWRGGMAMHIKFILLEQKSDRDLFLFDTFGKFPRPEMINSGEAYAKDCSMHEIVQMLFETSPSIQEVKSNFERFSLFDDKVHLLGGLFQNTIPKVLEMGIGKIAILRLDSDYYDSTLYVLEMLYDHVVPGGVVIVDDYNNSFVGCKDAVTYFREKRGITETIVDDYGGSVYWVVN